ncbi:unnamed protein product [Rotaria sp. Silwood1]|nr:unnamed protein product [Rotaria sp. Silwood1]CAF3390723.1 unnamed protein product [Rotaria sp. Silwood1]CAF3424406.1 unnamed protein product [Rotaria sp. Silwood1]CAF4513305.1 unnamed protein product [Rotaria sp. Silwood1]CAF4514427.1 unnamed protein product [Rotaria sp. Silwood1]
MTSLPISPNPSSKQTDNEDDEDDDDTSNSVSSPSNSKLSVEQGETRLITISEAIGLDFHSFIPQADITSQVHFLSNIQPGSPADIAGLKDGDRVLQVNGINITNLEHEDVRKLMQLMTPIILTVANDPKYLFILQQPVIDIEEKLPELPITANGDINSDTISRQLSRFELKGHSGLETMVSSGSKSTISTKSHRYETFNIIKSDESTKEESLKAKLCHLRKSKKYDGYGLVLKYQQDLHVIGEVEEASPSYRAGLRENDVIIFVGKKNVEKLTHDDVKVMIRAMTLASNQVELTVLSKSDIPRYKTSQEKGLIDWSIMGLEK